MTDQATPAKVRFTDGLGARSRSVTMAELLRPSEGSMVEFWCHRMSQQGKAGTGIRGWFRGGLFWSHDNADHYGPGEVTHWRGIRNALQCAARGCNGCLVCAPNFVVDAESPDMAVRPADNMARIGQEKPLKS